MRITCRDAHIRLPQLHDLEGRPEGCLSRVALLDPGREPVLVAADDDARVPDAWGKKREWAAVGKRCFKAEARKLLREGASWHNAYFTRDSS